MAPAAKLPRARALLRALPAGTSANVESSSRAPWSPHISDWHGRLISTEDLGNYTEVDVDARTMASSGAYRSSLLHMARYHRKFGTAILAELYG